VALLCNFYWDRTGPLFFFLFFSSSMIVHHYRAQGKNDEENGRLHSLKQEDWGKGVSMGTTRGSPQSPCKFLECHLGVISRDNLLG